MLDLKTPALEDLPILRRYCENYGTMGCDFNPVNIFIWRHKYNIKICFYDGFLILSYFRDEKPWGYCFPLGEGDPTKAIAEIFRDAKQRGIKPAFVMLTDAQKQKLPEITELEFSFEELTGDEDYIYTQYDLTLLPGQKYHGKRNHISKFNRTYPDWTYKTISDENFCDVLEVERRWCESKGVDMYSDVEYKAIRETLSNYDTLKIHGGLLYADKQPIAMTMGSGIDLKTFDVIFEKALTKYEGSYAKINNEFAKTLICYEFINREEDMGIESLRKSKLSYHPAVILKRYRGVLND